MSKNNVRPTETTSISSDFVVRNEGRYDAAIERQDREIANSGRSASIRRQMAVIAARNAKRGY